MKRFFEKLGAGLTSVRIWTVNLLTLVLLIYVVVLVVAVMRGQPAKIEPEGRVLMLMPEGIILDQEAFPADFGFPFDLETEAQVQARDLIELIRAAAADERLAGVLIDFGEARFSGPSTALQIARELEALRESGKPVIAFSETFTTASYLMAAQADEIYAHPSGALSISGLGGYRPYTRELTDKLKIKIHNYSQGDYKSALEGFTRNDMSEADREQRLELYRPIWATLKDRVAAARGIEADVVQEVADDYPSAILNEAAYDNLAFAESRGLIDGTKSFPEFRAYMIERFGKDEDEEIDTYPHIFMDEYAAYMDSEEPDTDDAVAVVFVEGTIQQGDLGPGIAGSDDVARLIRRAYEEENTRAIVLRVNSPGGSIIASDIIRDELVAAKSRGLPVVVSMGDVAASGGVWVSTPADRIFAEPTTITGSIGVAIAIPTLENSLDHVGIHYDGVATSEHAGWAPIRPIDEKLDAIFARFASSAYQRFVNTVAESRDRDPEYIRSIAGGRVWIGTRAQELGLIDELGSMQDAIAAAAADAELEEYRVDYVVKEPSVLFKLMQQFSGGASLSAPYGDFGRRVAAMMQLVEDVSTPRATVLCTSCMVELP